MYIYLGYVYNGWVTIQRLETWKLFLKHNPDVYINVIIPNKL